MAAHDPLKGANALARSLTGLLAPVVADAGLHLEGVETTRAGKYSVVRVFVDLADGPGPRPSHRPWTRPTPSRVSTPSRSPRPEPNVS